MDKELVLKVKYYYHESFDKDSEERITKYPLKKGNIIDLRSVTISIKNVSKDSIDFNIKSNTNIAVKAQKNDDESIIINNNDLFLNIKDKIIIYLIIMDATESWTLSLEYI